MTNHCTFKQCQALKEIGFDMPVRDYYYNIGNISKAIYYRNWNKDEDKTSAPTRSEVLQWAREKHGIDGWVKPYYDINSVRHYVYDIEDSPTPMYYNFYPTHPEAEDALIDKIIEILKEQKENDTKRKSR